MRMSGFFLSSPKDLALRLARFPDGPTALRLLGIKKVQKFSRTSQARTFQDTTFHKHNSGVLGKGSVEYAESGANNPKSSGRSRPRGPET